MKKTPTYSTDQRIREVAAMCAANGILNVVVCPGSRNAPIVHTLANTPGLTLHPVTDERSAGFVAIGIADATSRIVAVCCTSGSALLGLAPAVAEAYYRRIPLLIISGDRPAKWIGQMDGQTLEQNGAFGSMAHTFCLPENDTDTWHTNRMLNEAFDILHSADATPVHVNIPLSEPLFSFSAEPLPEPRIIKSVYTRSELKELSHYWDKAERPIIIVGQMNRDIALSAWLQQLVERKQCVVMAEHLSNTHFQGVISHFDDALARGLVSENMNPDLVLYIGGHIVSKRIKQFIRKVKPAHCWQVMPSDVYADLFQCLTARIVGLPHMLIDLLTKSPDNDRQAFCNSWADANTRCRAEITNKWTEENAVGIVISNLVGGAALSLANSSTVRHAQHFDLPADTQVQCNRGVNGIEGSLSSAVGMAITSARPVTYITGDLSFFYDMNALWNKALPKSFTIVLLNNECGEIFSHLPGLEASEHVGPYIAASHHSHATGWAADCGLSYFKADSTTALLEALKAPSESARLIECVF